MKKQILSMLLALCMLVSLLPVALAEDTELSLDDGSIVITETGYTQGSGDPTAWTSPYVITGSPTTNTIKIESGIIDLTIDSISIAVSDAPAISVGAGATLNLLIEGKNTLAGGDGFAGIYVAEGAALTISGSGELDAMGGANYMESAKPKNIYHAGGAGIGGNGYAYYEQQQSVIRISSPSFGTVTIESGTITAVGGAWKGGYNVAAGAGIGSGGTSSQGNLDAVPSGTIQIEGGAGIGGGDNGGLTSISISGGNVTAKASGGASGIGAGNDGFVGETDYDAEALIYGRISLNGSAVVNAHGGSYGGTGIGAGLSYNYDNGCGNISITGNATVCAYAGYASQAIGIGRFYGGNDPNSLYLEDTITLWAQTSDNTCPALLENDSDTEQYKSEKNIYLLSNDQTTANVTNGYLKLPGGDGTQFDYTLENGELTVNEIQISAAKPEGKVVNWATLAPISTQYTVEYNPNGGTLAEECEPSVSVDTDVTPTKPADPSWKGYVFAGWYTEAEGGEKYNFDAPINRDQILYAHWNREAGTIEPTAAAYRVEHYQEQLDGTYLTVEEDTQLLVGELGAAVTAEPNTYEHYHFNADKSNDTISGDVTIPSPGEDGTPQLLTLKVYYDLDVYTVKYDLSGGKANGKDYSDATVKYGGNVAVKDAPTKSGCTFKGWNDGTNIYQPGDTLTVEGNITLTAVWEEKNMPFPPVTPFPPVSPFPSVKPDNGEHVPEILNSEEHFAYIIGYEDGTVHPNASITRAEVATIFFRLLDEDIREENLTGVNRFENVNSDAWYNITVSTMAKLGIVSGRTLDRYIPDAPITRAEFAAICARFDTANYKDECNFTDTAGHWAEDEIARAAALGWITGYTDGSFRPNQNITRAEVMTTINHMLERLPEDEDDLLPDMNVFSDNQPGTWYYLAVQEATNSHKYVRKTDGLHEHWTECMEDPDWTQYL